MRAALIVALALGAGCLQVPGTTCEDGRICPTDRVCSSQGCVLPEQVEACSTLDDGDRCTFSGVANGRCVDGVCVSTGCGNDEVEADQGEVCDDGNTESGDGCRADCQKLEVCGDALPDQGEDCDDGNANAADGCDACMATTWAANPLVGGNAAATSVGLAYPEGVAVDIRGNVYVADTLNHRVRRIDAGTGAITTVAGSGTFGFSGDGGPATAAALRSPTGVAVDGLGTIYIADRENHRIRRVDAATGVITTVAGTGTFGPNGDGGPAISAQLRRPVGVALDGLGTLYIADMENHRIRRVESGTGLITTVAGTGTAGFNGDGLVANSAQLLRPTGVAVDGLGNLYIADKDNHRVRRVDADSRFIITVAGTGSPGSGGDGGLATAAPLLYPTGLAVDRLGNLHVADSGNQRIRTIDAATGVLDRVAGTGVLGFSGDGGPAIDAQLRNPSAVAVDGLGTVYIADMSNQRIRRVDAGTAFITTMAGSGSVGFSGDGGAATSARLDYPSAVVIDGLGTLYLADRGNDRIRRVDAGTGVIATVAGTGIEGFSGDDVAALSSQLNYPDGVAVDELGNVYVADTENHRVRRVDASTGVITTVAGTGEQDFYGDGGPATSAALDTPSAVVIDGLGTLYIADRYNSRIRRVDAGTGVITTVAGTTTYGFSGDGGPAISAELNGPAALAIDEVGTLYIVDTDNHRIRRVDASTGFITTVAGTITAGFSGDGGAATIAELDTPRGVAIDGLGSLYIADTNNHRVRRVDGTTGIITTVVGTAALSLAGDGAAATSAQLWNPEGVAVDGLGTLYIADTIDHCIRRVDADTGVITTVAGAVDPEGVGPVAQAHLADPRALVLTSAFALFAGGASGTVQAVRDDAGWLEVVAGRYPHRPATADLARFRDEDSGTVGGIAYDATAGVIYLSETSANRLHVVTLVDAADENSWTIAALADALGTPGFADGALATARFRVPTGLYLDEAARVLYVADTGNHVIRAIDLTTSMVTTIAGTPQTLGYFGDTGAATEAFLYEPEAITRCDNGDLFVADTGNHRVRRISAGVITTVLGDGIASSSGQGSPARDFPVNAPRGLACDAAGNLYVTSSTTVRQVAADDDGIVDGSLAVTSIFGAPPRDSFPASVTFCLTGLSVVDAATLQVTDSCTGMLIELRREAAP